MKEYKIAEFKKSRTPNEEIERFLAEKSAEGWEVVSLTVDISADLRGTVIILLQKEQ